MILPNDLKKKLEDLDIPTNQPAKELLSAIIDKQLEIGFDSEWEITDRGFEIEKLYDTVYEIAKEAGDLKK